MSDNGRDGTPEEDAGFEAVKEMYESGPLVIDWGGERLAASRAGAADATALSEPFVVDEDGVPEGTTASYTFSEGGRATWGGPPRGDDSAPG